MPQGQREEMGYNALGQMTWKKDFNGKTTTYTYDTRGRITGKTPDDSLNEQAVTWEYPNEFTRIARRGTNVTTWRFDVERGLLNEVEGENGTLRYGYDAGGNRTSLATVRNNTVETLTKYSYDALSRLEKVTAHDNTFTTYGYDAVGNRSYITRPNAVTTN